MRLPSVGVLAFILLGALPGGTVSAATNLSCKTAAVSGFGMNQPAANSMWRMHVTAEFGAAWASLGNAHGYAVHRHSALPGPNAVQVSATPCAVLPPTGPVNAPQPKP
jgi:hypothetical protein